MHKMPNYCGKDDSCSVFALAGRRTREIYLRAQEASTIHLNKGFVLVLLCPPPFHQSQRQAMERARS